jgi:hypothetical protein
MTPDVFGPREPYRIHPMTEDDRQRLVTVWQSCMPADEAKYQRLNPESLLNLWMLEKRLETQRATSQAMTRATQWLAGAAALLCAAALVLVVATVIM